MAEQAAPRAIRRQRHTAHARSTNARDAIVTCEPLVDEGEVRVEQRDDAAILLHDRAEQQLGLTLQRIPKVAVEIRRVGTDVLQLSQVQPLPGEVVHQRIGTRIRQHAAHLPLEFLRILQCTADGRLA